MNNTDIFAVVGAAILMGITAALSSIGMKNIMGASDGAIAKADKAGLDAPGNWSTVIPGVPMSQAIYAFVGAFMFLSQMGNCATWTWEFIAFGLFGGFGMGMSSWAQAGVGAKALQRISDKFVATKGEENPSALVRMGFPEMFALLVLAVMLLAIFA